MKARTKKKEPRRLFGEGICGQMVWTWSTIKPRWIGHTIPMAEDGGMANKIAMVVGFRNQGLAAFARPIAAVGIPFAPPAPWMFNEHGRVMEVV